MRDIQFYTIGFLRFLKIYHNTRLLIDTILTSGTEIFATIE